MDRQMNYIRANESVNGYELTGWLSHAVVPMGSQARRKTDRQAMDLARQLKPAAVLMDVAMPEMDGIEATRLLLSEMPEVRFHRTVHACARRNGDPDAGRGAVRCFVKHGPIEGLPATRQRSPRREGMPQTDTSRTAFVRFMRWL
jgi:CheY-like chemotaxis protein